MVRRHKLSPLAANALFGAFRLALAHGRDNEGLATIGMGQQVVHSASASTAITSAPANTSLTSLETYFTYPEYGGLIIAHIVLITVAWFFVLPIGVMLSISRSRLAFVVQLSFLGVHSIATLLGTIYKYNTPQLYEKDSHGLVGWIATWVVVAQCAMEAVKLAVTVRRERVGLTEERTAVLPITSQALEQYHQGCRSVSPDHGRFSGDSGHFTASEQSRSQFVSSLAMNTQEEQQKLHEFAAGHDDDFLYGSQEKRGLLGNKQVEHAATGILSILSKRTLRAIDLAHNFINRIVLVLGFGVVMTGAAVYGGVFRGHEIFNGLAHTIKGGIFFWYGLLTLGRWMGCFAEYGWAWNVRPPVGVVSSSQARIPSAEFVESFVIFLYGSTNVFLEHLAAWGKEWSPMDLEHLSITIMFFGGGLCGMLIESTTVRDLLNSMILTSPAGYGHHPKLSPPKIYKHSMNVLPSLVILLLGFMMSSHHQHSMTSTMIHKQWGNLFVGFALARAVTYILIYISPPTSYLPSRPPSELIASFCLISGGLIFIASNRDTVNSLEAHGIHAMFPFTVVMGFTAFLMSWAIIVLAVKGWAVRRNSP